MITFENVFKEYPNGSLALQSLNLQIEDGEFVFLVGSSGAGKSTLLKLLIREEEATRGKIIINGTDITRLRKSKIPKLRRLISVVFQDFRLISQKTVAENIAYALEIQGMSKDFIRENVKRAVALVGLEGKENSYPDQLSGGESQRVSIARAIVNKAPILVCDEPTGNLDLETAMGIMEALEKINKEGTTVIMATHATQIVDKMKKRVITLNDGKISSDVKEGGYYEVS
ncbi:cell division transport system ATP-binding protein [Peptoniphilus koenoeneniae]|uniref:Cell division ATP-binding protein FtsE n=1 Tax=Peptoniphilus koenoeneniae TaxID=507751 RepID=A0ABU0AUB2_9FIRM|nr:MULTISPECIES: cell division ATP-binding protein FtsE [Peptoniphilus]ERT58117.1 cell division ATP-binding protein FtsE [Peptoniphilus sp. BV3C26]MDQ0274825.1 cell division transport system ATP-binding protein [Peptoniphilus koenoeneniae]